MIDRTGRRRVGSLLTLFRAAPALLLMALLTMAALAACEGGDPTGAGNDRATTPGATEEAQPAPTRPSATATITPEATDQSEPQFTRPSATATTTPEATEQAGSAIPKLAEAREDGSDAPSFVSVSAGYEHTCGVRSDGSVACWGIDFYGEATPLEGSFVSVSAGNYHTCGVRSDASVACWGSDPRGQSTPLEGSFVSVSAGGNTPAG